MAEHFGWWIDLLNTSLFNCVGVKKRPCRFRVLRIQVKVGRNLQGYVDSQKRRLALLLRFHDEAICLYLLLLQHVFKEPQLNPINCPLPVLFAD